VRSNSQPFPFEVGTLAYKRCLSRGLHRVITVHGKGSEAFSMAIQDNFSCLLKGRPWMPLCAKLCNAEKLKGLPMLRKLADDMVQVDLWDYAFLQKHCATLDSDGNISDLYVTMQSHELLWADIRCQTPYKDSMETCWREDNILDLPSTDDGVDISPCSESADDIAVRDDPAIGKPTADILTARTPTGSKRAASEHSTLSGEEAGAKRKKVRMAVEAVERRAEPIGSQGFVSVIGAT
jgi:hypothetical protein